MTATGDTTAVARPTRDNVGFLLAKASQRWNELLAERFAAAGFAEVRPSYGSVLIPLMEEDGLRIGELARRARLSKQAMTELVRRLEGDGLVVRQRDPADGRASLIFLSDRAHTFTPVAARVLADVEQLLNEALSPRRVSRLTRDLRAIVALHSGDDGVGPFDGRDRAT